MHRPSLQRRPSAGTVLGGLALFVALGGTALAATGQLVNLVDGTNASNVAKVDSSGALRTSVATANVPVASKTFSVSSFVPNAYNAYGGLSAPTSAQIAVNRVVIGDDNAKPVVRDVLLYYATVFAGQTCNSGGGFATIREIGRYTVPAGGSVVDNMPTGQLLKPVDGRQWCLLVGSFAPTNTNTGFPNITVSGWVVSGTPPAGTGFRSARTESRTASGLVQKKG